MYLKFKIKVPAFIESIIVYFLLRYRKKHYGYEFRKIKLVQRNCTVKPQFVIVDPDDYQKLTGCNWLFCENKSGNLYAVRLEGNRLVSMHRVIMDAPAGKIVDHRNREGLDNRKSNLRFATHSQNNCNRKQIQGSFKYKGVSFHKPSKKWQAAIRYNGTRKFLGYFDNEEDAARAYDQAAKIYHGEFATLNFNEDSHEVTKAQGKDVRKEIQNSNIEILPWGHLRWKQILITKNWEITQTALF